MSRRVVFVAAMPGLRALQVYRSRITEQGLAGLSACKMLDSIEICSVVPISEDAAARLKAALPRVQTINVSQPELAGRPTRSRSLARM